MYPYQASYKVIHHGSIGTTKKLSFSQTGKPESTDLKVGYEIFFQLPGHSPPLYVSRSSFLQSGPSWFDWNDEEVVLFLTGKVESTNLNVG